MTKRLLSLIAITWMSRVGLVSAAEKVDFNYDIRPLISTNCYHCHGPDEKARKARLRLDQREDAIKEHESGQTIVPGDPVKSELMNRITSKDSDEVMPPPKEEHVLSAKEIDLFRRWIAEGAEYKPHWSFVKPERSAVPALAPGGAGAQSDRQFHHRAAGFRRIATIARSGSLYLDPPGLSRSHRIAAHAGGDGGFRE